MHASVMSRTRGLCVLAAVCLSGSAVGQSDDMTPVFYQWGSQQNGLESLPEGLHQAVRQSRVLDVVDSTDNYVNAILFEDGQLFFWGSNDQGHLEIPPVLELPGTQVVAIDVGFYHAIALDAENRVYCWGSNAGGAGDVPANLASGKEEVVDVAAGRRFSAALLADGRVIYWGDGLEGYTGNAEWDIEEKTWNTVFDGLAAAQSIHASGPLISAVYETQSRTFSDDFGAYRYGSTVDASPIKRFSSRPNGSPPNNSDQWRFQILTALGVWRPTQDAASYSFLDVTGSYDYAIGLRDDGFFYYQGSSSGGVFSPNDNGALKILNFDQPVLGGTRSAAYVIGVPYVINLTTGRFNSSLENEIVSEARPGDEIYVVPALLTADFLRGYAGPYKVISRSRVDLPAGDFWTFGGLAAVGAHRTIGISGNLQIAANSSVTLDGNRGLESLYGVDVGPTGRMSLNNNCSLQLASPTNLGVRGEVSLSTNSTLFNDVGGGMVVESGGEFVAVDASVRMDALRVEEATATQGRAFCLGSTFDIDSVDVAGGVLNILDGTLIGDVTVSSGITQGGEFNASGTLFGDLVNVDGRTTTLDDVVIVGDLFNEAGGIVAVQVGTMFVTGGIVNQGQIYGEVIGAPGFAGGGQTAAGDGISLVGDLVLGPQASIRFSEPLWQIALGGDFDVAIESPSQFELIGSTLRLNGASGTVQRLEATSRDIGPDPAAFTAPPAAVSLIRRLEVTSDASVQVVDDYRNAGKKGIGREAIYTSSLVVEAGGVLELGDAVVYCTEADIQGVVDRPEQIVVVSILPDADFNDDGRVDGADLAFILAFWGSNDPDVDLNGDGLVDAFDLGLMLASWTG